MQALPALWTYAAKLRLRTPVRRVWGLPPLRWLLYPAGTAPVLWLRGKPHSELPGLCEVERGEGRTCKAGARPWPKERRHSHLTAPKEQRAGPSAEQMDLGEGWNHVIRGGVLSRPLPQ